MGAEDAGLGLGLRVVIADDHKIVREGLRMILAHDPEVEVVAEAEDGAGLLALLEEIDVDLVLLDIRMPGLSGLEALEDLRSRYKQVDVVVLTMHDDASYVRRAVELGASGYLLKSVSRSELSRAIHSVAQGKPYIQGELTGPLVASMVDPEGAKPIDGIGDDQRLLLELVAEGLDNRQLAQRLEITEAAVKARLRGVFRSLGVKRRSEAVAVALRLGIIS
jgi:DNA-binding NarL/FixJ family response regulator